MDGYHIATSVFESQYTVKKSRFIARVVPIESRACALTAVDSAKKDFPDAFVVALKNKKILPLSEAIEEINR